MNSKTRANIIPGYNVSVVTALILAIAILFVASMNQINMALIPKMEVIKFGRQTVEVSYEEGVWSSIDLSKAKILYRTGIFGVIDSIEMKPIVTSEEEVVEEIEEFNVDLSEYDFELVGYVSASALNVREENSTESEILKTLYWNDCINYSIYDDKWGIIDVNGQAGFISLDYISDSVTEGKELPVVGDKRKSFMGWKKITDKSSKQYAIQKESYSDANTGVRMYRGRYCVAIGAGYGAEVGQYIDISLENGTVLNCIMADQKANCDTNKSNTIGKDGSAAEFIIDYKYISDDVKESGDLSDCNDDWNSSVVKIEVFDKSY